jgi:urease accessory protein
MQLTQWLSPAFPLGSFAYSHGLEWAISAREVTDAETLSQWLRDLLRHGSGRNDAILCLHALRGGDLDQLSDLSYALASSAERAKETRAQGAAFVRTLGKMGGATLPDHLPMPVALGAAARPLALPEALVLSQMLHAFVGNLVSVAVRFVPLGQTDGQAVLAALHPVIVEVAEATLTASLDDLGGAFLRGDLASLHHETMPTRLFVT